MYSTATGYNAEPSIRTVGRVRDAVSAAFFELNIQKDRYAFKKEFMETEGLTGLMGQYHGIIASCVGMGVQASEAIAQKLEEGLDEDSEMKDFLGIIRAAALSLQKPSEFISSIVNFNSFPDSGTRH